MKPSFSNRRVTLLSVLVLLLLWAAAALIAGSENLLPGPWQTFRATAGLLGSGAFLKVVGSTLLRALLGFAAAVFVGVALGIAGGLNAAVGAFLKPWIVVLRSTPVVAIVLLAVIWLSPEGVPVFIGALTMLPLVYLNIAEGILSVDGRLVRMARFYGLSGRRLVREVYMPAIEPFAVSGISNAVGIGWRAIVVGEVLSQPQWGLGTMMRSSQTFLQVDVLLAWTIVAVAFGAVFEALIRKVEKRYGHRSR